MCGIVAGVSNRPIVPVLVNGLRRLEYRGYDSCGVAVIEDGRIRLARSVRRVPELAARLEEERFGGQVGIAHTRWATHGAAIEINAHPHVIADRVALVHNGIIENYAEIRDELRAAGHAFAGDSDTEVLARLIAQNYQGDLLAAVRQALTRVRGTYAIAAISRDEPRRVVAARQGSPLVVGLAPEGRFVASDALALAGVAERVIYLEDGDIAAVDDAGVTILAAEPDGHHPVERAAVPAVGGGGAIELGPYQHFMQKEIFEQPEALANTLEGVTSVDPALFGAEAAATLSGTRRVLLLACGTSYYACLTACYWIESLAGLPCRAEIASEFRYRRPVLERDTLLVVVSQSGETADTINALRYARRLGLDRALAICNVRHSAMVRECALSYITRAGPEIGVASTKAFTTQLAALFLLTLTLARLGARLTAEDERLLLDQLRHAPQAVSAALALEPQLIAWAERLARREHALFLGRGAHYPIALEGALKLKEISYIHAEAYPAGELKHGPLALVDAAMPVLTIAPNNELLEKIRSNMNEVRARDGELYVLADAGCAIDASADTHVIRLPEYRNEISPLLFVVPLQLLAYHVALRRGTDVDKPRNLAKSVTVE